MLAKYCQITPYGAFGITVQSNHSLLVLFLVSTDSWGKCPAIFKFILFLSTYLLTFIYYIFLPFVDFIISRLSFLFFRCNSVVLLFFVYICLIISLSIISMALWVSPTSYLLIIFISSHCTLCNGLIIDQPNQPTFLYLSWLTWQCIITYLLGDFWLLLNVFLLCRDDSLQSSFNLKRKTHS